MKRTKIKEFFSSDFFGTIMVTFFSIFAIPMLSGIIALHFDENAIKKELAESDKIMVTTVQQHIERQLATITSAATSVSHDAKIREISETTGNDPYETEVLSKTNQLAKSLSKYLEVEKSIDNVYVVFGKKGIVVSPTMVETNESFFEKYYRESDFLLSKWNSILNRKSYGQYSIVYENEKKYIDFYFSNSLSSKRNNSGETIVVRISEAEFGNYVSKFHSFTDKQICVIDKNNDVVLNYGDRILKNYNYDSYNSIMKAEKTDDFTYTMAKSGSNNWKYVLSTSDKYIQKKVYYNRMLVIVNVLIYLIAAIIVVSIYMVKNYIPLRRIISKADGCSANSYDTLEKVVSEYNWYKTYALRYKRQYNKVQTEQFFSNIVSFNRNPKEIKKIAEHLKISLVSDMFTVILIDICDYEKLFEDDEIDEAERVASAELIVRNIFGELLSSIGVAYFLLKDDKQICILNLKNEENWKQRVAEILHNGKDVIQEHFEIPVTVCISRLSEGLENLRNAYVETVETNMKHWLAVDNEIVFCEPVSAIHNKTYYDCSDAEKILSFIKKGEKARGIEQMKNTIRRCASDSDYGEGKAKMFSVKLIDGIYDYISEEIEPDNRFYAIVNRVLLFKSYDGYIAALEEIIRYACNIQNLNSVGSISKTEKVSAENMVETIKSYISAEYTDSTLSLTRIGEYMGITPYYVSHTFKKVTGENLSDYISRFRIEKSKDVICNNDRISSARLAEMVGFGSERTFIRMFNKFENISVGQYKAMLRKDDYIEKGKQQ